MNMVGLPPGMIITAVGRDFDAEALVQVGGHRLTQGRNAVCWRVAVVALAQRLDRRLDDEVRGAEIGLADAEIDDVAPLPDQLIGAGEHREGIFLADAVESGDRFQHGITPRYPAAPNRPRGPDFARSSPDRAAKIKPVMPDCKDGPVWRILALKLSPRRAEMGIRAANKAYERWLAHELRGDLVEGDVDKKHEKMRDSAFAFLRATYWRWAETILEVCPDLAKAPAVLAVGDIHLENFGTWRDAEGRLIWGVNDYDEAAEMPYLLDLVRLAVSAMLATSKQQIALKAICANILQGYAHGLEAPEAFVLDRQHMWLRTRFVVGEAERAMFWQKIENQYHDVLAKKKAEQPPARWLKLLSSALPDPSIALAFWRRTAGTGSLGRPRWLGYGIWRGGPLLREGKALVPSGWTRAHGGGTRLRLNDIALGNYRAPDPWYGASGNLLVRRLSPNNRKINVEDWRDAARLLHPDLLWAMGRDLAAIHLGQRDRRDALRKDLEKRKSPWFRAQVEAAADFVSGEYAEWKKSAK